MSQLRQLLVDHYSEGELRTLCFDLGVDYESLPPGGKADKARELLAHLERHGRIPTLLEIGHRLRPDVDWAQVYLDDRMDDYRTRRDQADQVRRERRARQRVVNLCPLDMAHTFRDRVRETQELCMHLTQENVRLISVVGRGGMGKTALVSRVLADLEHDVLPVPGQNKELAIDGLLYLSALSTGLSLERIYADVGRMLGEPSASRLAARWANGEMPLSAKVEYLLETMQDGLYIILLDNLENYLTPGGAIADEGLRLFVERCLTRPGGARLVATSREHVQVIPAALRNARSIPLREGLPVDEAIALLRELDPQGELGLRDTPEDDLRQAIQLTNGIPRALEIIAGILQADPASSLARLVNDRELFSGQVVENLVAASHQRLGENERRVMEALAVFDCPVEETAIAYLLHPWHPALDMRAGLRHLTSGYFASVNRNTGEYSLHPLDREYAYRHLPEEIETEIEKGYTRRNLELRAADFYASIRKPENEWKTIEDLAPQLAEFEHRVRVRNYIEAAQLLEPIDYDRLLRWGHYTRLVRLRETLVLPKDTDWYVSNLICLGRAYRALGRVETAIKLYTDALDVIDHIGSCREKKGTVLNCLGRAYHDLSRYEEALISYEEALTIFREVSSRWEEGDCLGNLGHSYRVIGRIDQAIEFYQQALEIARETGHHREEGVQLGRLSIAYRALGQIEQALELNQEALRIACAIGDRREEGLHLGRLGIAHIALGQWKQAIDSYEGALAVAREIGDRRYEGVWLGYLGRVYRALGQDDRAKGLYEESLNIACAISDRRGQAGSCGNLGLTCFVSGDMDQAVNQYRKALDIAKEIKDRKGQSTYLLGLGKALLNVEALAEAGQYCESSLALDVPETSYRAALTLGIVLLHQRSQTAIEAFANVGTRCSALLEKTFGLYEPRYVLATALVGQAVCDPRWADADQRAELLAPAIKEYRRALEITSAAGIVSDAIRDLELIRRAGIEGLEPLFELLRSAI